MSVIHEGSSAFAAAQDFIINFNVGYKDAKTSARKFDKGGYLNKSSIMKATKDLTMRFPVICSDTITPGSAAMVTKAVERNATTTLQLLFASTYLRGKSGSDVISKFHKNIDDDISMDDYLSMADGLAKAIDGAGAKVPAGGAKFANTVNKFATMFGENTVFMTEQEFIAKATEELKNGHNILEEDYADYGIYEFIVNESGSGELRVVQEAGRNKNGLPRTSINTYRNNGGNNATGGTSGIVPPTGGNSSGSKGNGRWITNPMTGNDIPYDQFNANMDYARYMDDQKRKAQQVEIEKTRAEAEKQKAQNQKDINDFTKRRLDNEDRKFNADMERNEKLDKAEAEKQANFLAQQQYTNAVHQQQDQFDYFQKQLKDNDVRKCNELVPSLIIIRYNVVDATEVTSAAVEQQFIAGVKAWMYPETSGNIIDKISAVFSKNTGKLGWIKATTGEINFMKDFVLGIKNAKISAKNDNYMKVSPIWKHLKYRSNKSVLNRLFKNKANDAGAITTLVISAEEANYLQKELGVNMADPKIAQKVMDAYNFMGIVIVDENFEVARFLFDGAAYYEDIAFSSLERESNDSSYKKVVNLISKINRG